MKNQQKSNKKRKRDFIEENDENENDEKNNIFQKKKVKRKNNCIITKELNDDKEKFEIIVKHFEKEGYESILLIKSLFYYWVGGYKKFLYLFDNNNSFKRRINININKGDILLLLSYEKFCKDVVEEIRDLEVIVFIKEHEKERGKDNDEKIHKLIDYLYKMIQNNENIDEYFYLYRGSCYKLIGNTEKALSVITEGIKLTKNNLLLGKMYYNRGYYLETIKDFVGSIECYNKTIELEPNFALSYNNKGNLLMNMKDFVGAIECYNKTIELDPNYSHAYYNKGNSLVDIKDYVGAIECYNKAIELDPHYANAYHNKGNTFTEIKDYVSAIECYNKAIEMVPNDSDFYYNLSICYKEMEMIKKAISCLNKAISLNPTNGEYYDILAHFHEMNSKFLESIYFYTKAINLIPENCLYIGLWRNSAYSQLKEKIIGFDFELFNSFDDFSF